MCKYIFKNDVTAEKIIESFKEAHGSDYEIEKTDKLIKFRKSPFIGAVLRYTQKDDNTIIHGPSAYYALWVAFLFLGITLLIFTGIVTLSTGAFNPIIGGAIPILIAAIAARLPSRSSVSKLRSVLDQFPGEKKDFFQSFKSDGTSGASSLSEIKNYSQLFNKQRFGFNYQFMLALALTMTLSAAILFLANFGLSFSRFLPSFLPVIGIISLVSSLLLVLASHYIKIDWLIPFVWGFIVFLGQFVNTTFFPVPSMSVLETVMAFLYMAALIASIRLWGANIKAFIIGLAGIELIIQISLPLMLGAEFMDVVKLIIVGITVRTAQAILLYYSFVWNQMSAKK